MRRLAFAHPRLTAIAATCGNCSAAGSRWISTLFMVGVFLGLSGVSLPAFAQEVEYVRADLEKAADQIDLLDPLSIGNAPAISPDEARAPYQPARFRMTGTNYSASSLISLLSDTSPRVRTLALELLFRKQDAQFLPYIFEHASDNEDTFEHLVYYNFRDNGPPNSKRAPQSVADFAKAMLGFFGVRGDFREFWTARKDRSYWFGWLYSRLSLITGGLPTLNPGVRAQLAPFREELERLPNLDRNLYLIWLQCTFTEPALADDAELSQAVRRLGRENVLAIAEGNPPGGDPDLSPSWDAGRYWHTASIVLLHASGVLRREDAPRIAAVIDREREHLKQHLLSDIVISVSYTIGQASLLPERASELLHAEINRLAGPYRSGARGQLTAALMQLTPGSELPGIRNLFYDDPEIQPGFIVSLLAPDYPKLEQLLDDPRCSALTPSIMVDLYRKFPNLRPSLMINWFYSHDHNREPWWNWGSVDEFLSAAGTPELLREIVDDDRLPRLPLPVLFRLEQKAQFNDLPKSFYASFPLLDDFRKNWETGQLSEATMDELIRFLRQAVKFEVRQRDH